MTNYVEDNQKFYDCEKFIDIRNRMIRLTGELKACEDHASEWWITLETHLRTLREALETWTEATQEISGDCLTMAVDFRYKL